MRALFILLALTLSALAREITVTNFDAEKKTIADLSTIIRKNAATGHSIIRFPTGQWRWYTPKPQELPAGKKLTRISLKATDKQFLTKLETWLKETNPPGIQVALDPSLPAQTWFQIEQRLRKKKIPNWLVSQASPGKNTVILMETDSQPRVIVPPKLGTDPQ